jgi:hypothetical protein
VNHSRQHTIPEDEDTAPFHQNFNNVRNPVFWGTQFLTLFKVPGFPAPSTDGGWLAEVALFHGHTAATFTNIFHGG